MSMVDRRKSAERRIVLTTGIGPLGLAWNGLGLTRVRLLDSAGNSVGWNVVARSIPADLPAFVTETITLLDRYAAGLPTDFGSLPLDLSNLRDFERGVYEAARRIEWGKVATYGDLARAAGSPLFARAVGQAMARNPLPIIIPCHRVVATTADACVQTFRSIRRCRRACHADAGSSR